MRQYIREGDELRTSWNHNMALGGPVVENRLWFFTAFRILQNDSYVAVTAGYYRRQFYNIAAEPNLAVDPDVDYTPFTVVGPTHADLPNGGGLQRLRGEVPLEPVAHSKVRKKP